MGKWMKLRAGFSGFMAMAVLAGSFSASAAVQERMAGYEGVLICGQEGHTHDRSCYDQASASDAKKEPPDIDGGLVDLPDPAPGPDGTGTGGSGSGDMTAEGSALESDKTESPEPEKNDLQETGLKETDPEEGIALMSARLEREGNTFRVSDLAGLKEAIAIAQGEIKDQEEDKEVYQIELEADINDWNERVDISGPVILIKLNGHSIKISTRQAICAYNGGITIQGTGAETITVASSVELGGSYDNYIFGGGWGPELEHVRITAESNEKNLPPLVQTEGGCVLNDVTVEDYPVHGSLISLEPIGGGDPGAGLTIQGGTFSGIHSDGSGAVVNVTLWRDYPTFYSAGRTVIHDAVFRNNTAKGGGAIMVFSENGMEIKGCVFEGNQATGEENYDGDGGAVYVSGFPAYSDVDIDGCSFTDNIATGSGGAIYCEENDLSIVNSTFEVNQAFDGGAVAALDGRISKTSFTDNRAENNGGAVYANGAVRMEDVTLLANKAKYRGGAVYMEENIAEDGTSRSELILTDAVITGNYASENGHAVECTHSLQMEGGRCPAIFENNPLAWDGIYLHPSAKAGTVYGTMLGEGDAGLKIIYASGAGEKALHKGEAATIDPSSDGAIRLAFHPSGTKGILALSPVVLMDGNDGGLAGSAIYGTSITFITSEKKAAEDPDPEKPDPEEPEKPSPEEPEKPGLEEPEKPGTGGSTSGQTPSVSSGGRRRRERDRSVSGSNNTSGGSSSPGMSITKPYYLHPAASGREMSDARPGWRLRKPDGSYAASEWVLETDGSWYLYGEDGYTCSGWQKVNGEWYFFDETAQNMKTSWLIREGKWYYLDTANGSMKTGWISLEGKWYFLSPDGALVTNGYTPDGYYVDGNGEWKGSRR